MSKTARRVLGALAVAALAAFPGRALAVDPVPDPPGLPGCYPVGGDFGDVYAQVSVCEVGSAPAPMMLPEQWQSGSNECVRAWFGPVRSGFADVCFGMDRPALPQPPEVPPVPGVPPVPQVPGIAACYPVGGDFGDVYVQVSVCEVGSAPAPMMLPERWQSGSNECVRAWFGPVRSGFADVCFGPG